MSIYATVLHSDYFFSRKFLGWYAVFILTIYNNDFLGINICKYTCTFQSNIYMVKDWAFLRCDSLNPHNFIYELGAILEKVAPSIMNGSREIKRSLVRILLKPLYFSYLLQVCLQIAKISLDSGGWVSLAIMQTYSKHNPCIWLIV